MTQPWLRKARVTLGPIAEYNDNVGPIDATQRNRALVIESDGTQDTLRVRFNVQVHSTGVLSPAQIDIYNLSQKLRNQLLSYPQDVAVTLDVGWENDDHQEPFLNGRGYHEIFSGGIYSAYSQREGADIVTTFNCLSGVFGAHNSVSGAGRENHLSFLAGTPIKDVVVAIAGKLLGITPIASKINVGSAVVGSGGLKTLGSYLGCLYDLARIYGFTFRVVNREFTANLDGGWLPGDPVDITSENGFLKRVEPILEAVNYKSSGVVISSLLNPLVYPGKLVNVKSAIQDNSLTGSYVAQEYTHSGDTCSNQWDTVVRCTTILPQYGAGR